MPVEIISRRKIRWRRRKLCSTNNFGSLIKLTKSEVTRGFRSKTRHFPPSRSFLLGPTQIPIPLSLSSKLESQVTSNLLVVCCIDSHFRLKDYPWPRILAKLSGKTRTDYVCINYEKQLSLVSNLTSTKSLIYVIQPMPYMLVKRKIGILIPSNK